MNIALIEFNPFHDECLYSQVLFLRSLPETNIYLVYNYNLKDRIDYWDQLNGHLPIGSNQWVIGYIKILRFLKRNKVDIVIFNSTHYPSVSNLLKFSTAAGTKYYGLVHDLDDLIVKQTDELRKRMNGYFVLNDYLLTKAKNIDLLGAKITSFYPIFFPERHCREIDKGEEEIWITIPGLMESFRRDYQSLLDSFSSGTLKKNIKLIFLGRSVFKKGNKVNLRKKFEEIDKNNQCVFWDEFVDKTTFNTYLKYTDYLLPLIHLDHQAGNRFTNKISGSFNLGFGYSIPFLMDNHFKEIEDFKDNAVFYNSGVDLVSVLNKLEKPNRNNVYQQSKWQFDYQANRYLEFIGLIN